MLSQSSFSVVSNHCTRIKLVSITFFSSWRNDQEYFTDQPLDSCYRMTNSNFSNDKSINLSGIVLGSGSVPNQGGNLGSRPQRLILMEYCEGGTALDVCTRLKSNQQHFDLPSLIIAFGQICNAVSYLHAQRPPIVHRDLKPVNFLVKNGAYKLCDFGSAVFGHVDLRTSRARSEAERRVIEKTTTQMFRSPEMVDLCQKS